MNPNAKRVWIVDGRRTPFLKARNAPGPFLASDLALYAARSLFQILPIKPRDLDEVIMGCVMPGPDEANIGRLIALRLGCDEKIPAWTVQRNCASGLQALHCAVQSIQLGNSHLVLAGGTESMSHAPLLFGPPMAAWLGKWSTAKGWGQRAKALQSFRPTMLAPIIGLLRGLTDPLVGLSMGQTAEILAGKFQLNRLMLDSYAARSHQRLAQAQDQNLLGEIEPIYDAKGNFYSDDDGLRRDSDPEKLGKLRPVFDRGYGMVTAGNSAQITDGAACLLLASDEAVEKYRLPLLGKVVDVHWAGLDPSEMGLGPVHAMTPIMQRNNLSIGDIDYWEINEAFAAQVLACVEAWKQEDYCKTKLNLDQPMGEIPPDRLNIHGGGVCIGHPVGASGARIVLHLLNTLHQQQAKRGMASLCIGGGQGGAMLVERAEQGVQAHG